MLIFNTCGNKFPVMAQAIFIATPLALLKVETLQVMHRPRQYEETSNACFCKESAL